MTILEGKSTTQRYTRFDHIASESSTDSIHHLLALSSYPLYSPVMPSKRTYITIPAKDYAEAKKKAKTYGLSFSALVRMALKMLPAIK